MFNYLSKLFRFEHTASVNRKMIVRSMMLGLLTVIGFGILEYLIQMTQSRGWTFITRFPEFPTMMRAACFMTFAELTVLWIRLATQPRLDVQEAAQKAMETSLSSAIVYATHALIWGFRTFVFLKICDLM